MFRIDNYVWCTYCVRFWCVSFHYNDSLYYCEFSDFIHVVSISFSALIITELIMVAMTVHTWLVDFNALFEDNCSHYKNTYSFRHWAMLVAQGLSLGLYAVSLIALDKFFDRQFVLSWVFLTKVVSITLLSCAPLYGLKMLRRKFRYTIYPFTPK